MKPTEFWRWYTPHPHRPGKLIATRHRMTEAQALASYPGATRVPDTAEVRNLAETEQELQGLDSGRWAQKSARPARRGEETADQRRDAGKNLPGAGCVQALPKT